MRLKFNPDSQFFLDGRQKYEDWNQGANSAYSDWQRQQEMQGKKLGIDFMPNDFFYQNPQYNAPPPELQPYLPRQGINPPRFNFPFDKYNPPNSETGIFAPPQKEPASPPPYRKPITQVGMPEPRQGINPPPYRKPITQVGMPEPRQGINPISSPSPEKFNSGISTPPSFYKAPIEPSQGINPPKSSPSPINRINPPDKNHMFKGFPQIRKSLSKQKGK